MKAATGFEGSFSTGTSRLVDIAFVLLGVVGVVLAVACSNLATLLLVRGAARAKEMSIRLALGATQGQLVRQLLLESLLLSTAAGAVGGILAWWSVRSLAAFDLPLEFDLHLDYRVLIFTAGVSLVTGVAFGLAPALKATRIELVPTLREDGDTLSADRHWFTVKNALVVFQVAVSVALLGATGIFLQMLDASRARRAGFAIDGVGLLQTDVRYAGYSATQARHFTEDFRRRVSSIPGVQSAAIGRGLPMEVTGARIITDAAPAGPSLTRWPGSSSVPRTRLDTGFASRTTRPPGSRLSAWPAIRGQPTSKAISSPPHRSCSIGRRPSRTSCRTP